MAPVVHLPIQRSDQCERTGKHDAYHHELAHGVDVAEAIDEHLDQQVHENYHEDIGETCPYHGHGGHAHPAQEGIDERAMVHAKVAFDALAHGARALPVLHPLRASNAHQGAEKEVEREDHEEEDHGIVVSIGEHAALDMAWHDRQEQGCQQAGAVPEGRAGDHEDRYACEGSPYGRR